MTDQTPAQIANEIRARHDLIPAGHPPFRAGVLRLLAMQLLQANDTPQPTDWDLGFQFAAGLALNAAATSLIGTPWMGERDEHLALAVTITGACPDCYGITDHRSQCPASD